MDKPPINGPLNRDDDALITQKEEFNLEEFDFSALANYTNSKRIKSFEEKIFSMSKEEAVQFFAKCGRDDVDLLVLKLHTNSLLSLLQKVSMDEIERVLEEMGEGEIRVFKERIDTIKDNDNLEALRDLLEKKLTAQKDFRVIEKQDTESFLEVITVANIDQLMELAKNINARQRFSFLERIDGALRERGFILVDHVSGAVPVDTQKDTILDVLKSRIQFIKKVRIAEKEGVVLENINTNDTNFIIPPRIEMRGAFEDFIRSKGMEIIPPADMAAGQDGDGTLNEAGMVWLRILYEFVREKWGNAEAHKIIQDISFKISRK